VQKVLVPTLRPGGMHPAEAAGISVGVELRS
jgi:hypothetical protein